MALPTGCSASASRSSSASPAGSTSPTRFTYTLRRVHGVHVQRSASGLPFWPVGHRSASLVVGGRRCRASSGSSTGPSPRSAGATALLAIFVASLGIGIAGENLIRLLLGRRDQAVLRARRRCVHRSLGTTTFLNFDVWQVGQRHRARARPRRRCLRYTPLGRADQGHPGATPSWPGSSASTPNQHLPGRASSSARCFAASPPSGTALQVHGRPGHGLQARDLRVRRRLPRRHRPLADPGLRHRHRRRPDRAVLARSGCRCGGRRPPSSSSSCSTSPSWLVEASRIDGPAPARAAGLGGRDRGALAQLPRPDPASTPPSRSR